LKGQKTHRKNHPLFIEVSQEHATLRVRQATSDIQGANVKTEYVFALAALYWCLIINSAAQAESPQINVVPYSTPLPSDSLVRTLSDEPKNSSGNKTAPSTEVPQGVRSRAESRESVGVKNATIFLVSFSRRSKAERQDINGPPAHEPAPALLQQPNA